MHRPARAGLALIALAFLPPFAAISRDVTFNALALLGTHATFSLVKFYGTPVVPAIQRWPSLLSARSGADGAAAVKVVALARAPRPPHPAAAAGAPSSSSQVGHGPSSLHGTGCDQV